MVAEAHEEVLADLRRMVLQGGPEMLAIVQDIARDTWVPPSIRLNAALGFLRLREQVAGRAEAAQLLDQVKTVLDPVGLEGVSA
jgi:hypothetical protein